MPLYGRGSRDIKLGRRAFFCKFCRAVFFVEYRLKLSLYMAEIGSTRTDNPIDFSNFEPINLSDK